MLRGAGNNVRVGAQGLHSRKYSGHPVAICLQGYPNGSQGPRLYAWSDHLGSIAVPVESRLPILPGLQAKRTLVKNLVLYRA